ncbi:uncharacterized protein LOC143151769 isoform X2 [Ptiloglossa arizonensis]|uniref:uncharacterized protein LOC143151769 isoform X2 n=1 Tax=Ptiloglossa arizonensis TaxID=3350558 RepID=UPI003FA03856
MERKTGQLLLSRYLPCRIYQDNLAATTYSTPISLLRFDPENTVSNISRRMDSSKSLYSDRDYCRLSSTIRNTVFLIFFSFPDRRSFIERKSGKKNLSARWSVPGMINVLFI